MDRVSGFGELSTLTNYRYAETGTAHAASTRVQSLKRWSYALAFGANVDGTFGSPDATLIKTIDMLRQENVKILAIAQPIVTRPVGGMTRRAYLNTVIVVQVTASPADLLRRLKRFEQAAGRRGRARNSARPLDLDILLWRGGRVGWKSSGAAGRRDTGSAS